MKNKLIKSLLAFALLSTLSPQLSTLCAQGTAFTYQGRLNTGGAPANGTYDLLFTIYDLPTGSGAFATQTNAAMAVSNGLFTVSLDFGTAVFTGPERWLEIAVRTNGGGAFTNLSPRQKITSAPYAIRSANAASAVSVSGSVSAAQLTGTIAPANIANGSINSSMLAAGAVTAGALAEGAVTAAKVATVSNWFALTIANPTPADFDYFGSSVAAVGTDRVLIAAPHDDTAAGDSGAVYLFSINGALLTTFTKPPPAAGGYFGYSVAAVGTDRVLIGAAGDDTGAPNAGAAYLFSTNGTLLTTFTNPTPADSDGFGYPVAAVGTDRVLIGAYQDDTGAYDAGTAYLFSTNGTLLTTFTNPTPADVDYFGSSVAAVGTDRVLIGAPQDSTGADRSGAAYLFSTNGTLLTTFTNPTPAFLDWFGNSVAAVGTDRVLIGEWPNDPGAPAAGAAYLFSTSGELLTTFTSPAPANFDSFGYSVAAVGTDRVLIGAYQDNTGAPVGVAYLFSTNGTLLATFTNPTPAAGDWFGNSVAAVGTDRVLIGANQDSTGAFVTGAAYLFSVETYAPGLVPERVNSGSITTASLQEGAVTATKIGGVLFTNQIPALDASKITSGTFDANRIPNLDASKISSGILADARLSANVARLNATQTFTGNNTIAAPAALSFGAATRQMLNLWNNAYGIGVQSSTLYQRSDFRFSWFRAGTHSNFENDPGAGGTRLMTLDGNGELHLGGGIFAGLSLQNRETPDFVGGPTTGERWVWYVSQGSCRLWSGNNKMSVNTNGVVTAISFNPTSDRNAKENFEPIDSREVLKKVAALPITRWNFKQDAASEHIGPMAQDFHAAFGTGSDDKHIATVDADGVALAAIQGLNQKVDSENARLKEQLNSKESRITELERRLAALEQWIQSQTQKGN